MVVERGLLGQEESAWFKLLLCSFGASVHLRVGNC